MRDEPLTVSEMADLIEETHESWMQLLESAPTDQWEEPGVSGDWSLKDITAHIAWHEDQMARVIEARALVGSDWWNLPTDERNANIYAATKDAPLESVIANARAAHEELVCRIRELSDSDLNETGHFAGMPDDWLFGEILAQNTFEHYGDHAATVARWLADREHRA